MNIGKVLQAIYTGGEAGQTLKYVIDKVSDMDCPKSEYRCGECPVCKSKEIWTIISEDD